MADNLTREQRSKAMSRIRRRDTKPEKSLRQAVWERGLRGYRLDDRRLPGRPDLAWTRHKVAVFVDGAFWHGHPSAFTRGKSGEYWDQKIARNMERDRDADQALRAMGWEVLRFWDFEVQKDINRCIERIERAMNDEGIQADEPSLEGTLEPLPEQHRRALRWFADRQGREVPWPAPLPDGTLLACKAKGIYKPRWSKYALSVRESLSRSYPDEEPKYLSDGSWTYRYFQENIEPVARDSEFTNLGLLACIRDFVPVGVLRQVADSPTSRYRVLGVAFVRRWSDGFFELESVAS